MYLCRAASLSLHIGSPPYSRKAAANTKRLQTMAWILGPLSHFKAQHDGHISKLKNDKKLFFYKPDLEVIRRLA